MIGGVNRWFFNGFLFLLLLLYGYHFALIPSSGLLPHLFFFLHALSQVILEVIVLSSFAALLKKRVKNGLFFFFIASTFLYFLLHIVDFFLVRFMGLPLFKALSIVLGESYDNFIEMLILTEMPLPMWMLFFLSIVMLPFLGVWLYKKSERAFDQKRFLKKGFLYLPLVTVLWSFSPPHITPKKRLAYEVALPWKHAFVFSTKKKKPLVLSKKTSPLLPLKNVSPLEKKPNIYLFVIESLRSDFITKKNAPNLFSFKERYIAPKRGWASSNATHISWFSLFHSKLPWHWSSNTYQKSPPLELLSKLGYQLHLYSSANFGYYKMNEVLFGKGQKLLHSNNFYSHIPPKEAVTSDREALEKLFLDQSQREKEGHCSLLFLDATHFNYSFDAEVERYFKPVGKRVPLLPLLPFSQKDLEKVKNRYRSAIYSIDQLFGRFIENLKAKGEYDEAIIIVTGDHGEEFFEKGRLFHASHLSEEQLRVPLFFKLGQKAKKEVKTCSHIDLFPTLFDALGVREYNASFDGSSLLSPNFSPLILLGRFNGGYMPEEYLLVRNEKKQWLELESESEQNIHFLILEEES